VTVAHGTPCLGPVTQAGCGALCPAVGRGCYGCFGPLKDANVPAVLSVLRRAGTDETQIARSFATFNVGVTRPAAERGNA
jgi:coenzyme F420-reducing hydrogenase gamma subunit